MQQTRNLSKFVGLRKPLIGVKNSLIKPYNHLSEVLLHTLNFYLKTGFLPYERANYISVAEGRLDFQQRSSSYAESISEGTIGS